MVCSDTHKISNVTLTAVSVALTANDSTDIGNLQRFNIVMNKTINGIIAEPLPVTISVNGETIPLKNRFGQQILSNRVPFGFSVGYYVADELEPYVILLNTPPLPRYA